MVKKKSSISCVHKSSCLVSSKVCGMVRMHKERLRGEEAVLMKTPKWKWRRRWSARKLDEQ